VRALQLYFVGDLYTPGSLQGHVNSVGAVGL
jgi:hypothetical protein